MIEPRRGDVVSVAERGGGDYAGKPRPALVLQADRFGETSSLIVCLLTSEDADAPLLRVRLEPSATLPLRTPSWAMVDKLTSVARARIGGVIGHASAEDMLRVERALVVVLGIG
jgi:mRNA interferase MazF